VQGDTPSPPRSRDVWHAYLAGDQRYGYEHVVVRRNDDGTFCYEVETRLLMDVLGQHQKMTEMTKAVVTADYAPVSLDVQSKTLAGPSRLQGKVEKGQFMVIRDREGGQARVSVPLVAHPLLRVCLDDWLNSRPAEARTVAFDVLNETLLKVESATATRTHGGAAIWDVEMGLELGRWQLTFDADGIRRVFTHRMPDVCIERSPPAEARKIRHRTMQGREVLMFPVGKPISAPERLNSLTVRLTWQGIKFDQFHLEDERQKVVRRAEKDDRFEAVVRICPASQPAGELDFPVQGDEYRPWLGENDFIKPTHPEIVRQAREWIGGEKTALGAVRALTAAEFKHMQGGAMIAETLSGPEVLRTRKGKCSEYAVLFASLARSAGIPTRIVLGMRLTNGFWIGHMWNEAYVGCWTTVDASLDEVGGSPALLKLVHSESVLGTQPLRWALTQSLDVAVDEFDPSAALLAGGLKTGIEGPVYTNAEFACRITAPDKSWALEDLRKPMPTICFKIPKRDDVYLHFVALSMPAFVTPTMLLDRRSVKLKEMHKGYEVLASNDYVFNRIVGRMLVSRWESTDKTGGKIKETAVMWSTDAGCYLVNLEADEKSHDEYAAAFFKLLGSFETLPRVPRSK